MAAWPYNTAAWRDLRQAKLSDQPLCEVCLRRDEVEPAAAVDHIVAINAGGEPFPPLSGLMSLCLPCHSWKTNHEDRPDRRRKLGGLWKGSAVDGGSLDPDDDWHTAPHTAPHSAVGVNRAQTPAEAQRAPAATHGPPVAPGGFEGRGSTAAGPVRQSKKELVANDSQLEADRWV